VISSVNDLRPGDVVFGPISGPAGHLVRWGQVFTAPWRSLLTWKTWWRINHVAMVTERGDGVSLPMIGQAMPTGFEIVPLQAYQWSPDYVFIRPRYGVWVDHEDHPPLATAMEAVRQVRRLAEARVGYGFAAYPRLAARRLKIPSPSLDRWVQRTDPATGLPLESICSQAIDWALTQAGGLDGEGHVFDDGRKPFDVVPSELYVRLLALDPVDVIRPGKAMLARRRVSAKRGELNGWDRPFRDWTPEASRRFKVVNAGLL
jgi:hypothetical protein